MRVLNYQCPAGISGDMNLGAMIDLGVDPAVLVEELGKLGLDGWELTSSRDMRGGITGIRCDVVLTEGAHDHHHGAEHHHHHHDHAGEHHHHDHTEGHHHHHHEDSGEHHHDHVHGRTYRDIRALIESSSLADPVKADALAVFHVLAVAEGKVHNIPAEDVHFHEVGAVDSIIDIVGAAICWHLLEVDALVCTTLELGGGTVACAHRRMPVPAPATAQLLTGLPVTQGATDKEATTPTGAALLVGKQAGFGQPLRGRLLKAGIGVGQRDDPRLANVVYANLLETDTASSTEHDQIVELATNLDDMRPEAVASLMEKLLEAGALDAWQTAATFKKGRLGVVVQALAEPTKVGALEDVLFRHASTLGVRRRNWERRKLRREIVSVATSLGDIRVKRAYLGEMLVREKPEFDDLQALADKHRLSLAEVEAQLHHQLNQEAT